jgi:hypothetical protein
VASLANVELLFGRVCVKRLPTLAAREETIKEIALRQPCAVMPMLLTIEFDEVLNADEIALGYDTVKDVNANYVSGVRSIFLR